MTITEKKMRRILSVAVTAAVMTAMALPVLANTAAATSAPPGVLLSAQALSPVSHGTPEIMATRARERAAAGELGSGPLLYHGGPVQPDAHLHLIFWGLWWASGCAGSLGHGSADESYLFSYFHGRGTSQDGLSNVLTQYPDSAGHGARFPVTPQGHVFSDWGANCSNPPRSATDGQLAAVAVAYASYLKAHGTAIGRNDQIVVISPPGTNPGGGFGSQYCAYHNWAAYGGGDISWTNLPYLPAAGGTCGANAIQGPFDGWSIVGGHEFAESANDPLINLHSAWYDAHGFEIGDKCAWTGIFIQGLPTGHFAEQPEWSNEDNSCQRSDIVQVAFPGNKTTKKGTAVSLQIQASAPDPVTFSATGLPNGLSISSGGRITGHATAAIGNYKVSVYGREPATSVSGHTDFKWTVTS